MDQYGRLVYYTGDILKGTLIIIGVLVCMSIIYFLVFLVSSGESKEVREEMKMPEMTPEAIQMMQEMARIAKAAGSQEEAQKQLTAFMEKKKAEIEANE